MPTPNPTPNPYTQPNPHPNPYPNPYPNPTPTPTPNPNPNPNPNQDQPDGRFPQGSPPSRRLASGASVLCSPEPLAPATSAAGFLPEASAPFRGSSPGDMPFPSTLPSTPQTTLCTLTAG